MASLDPSAILAQLIESYVKLPLAQKIVFPMLVIGSVMGIVLVSKWANQPDYAVLFSDLEPADSAAIVQRLKEQKIKYEVRGDGDTIAISPPEIVHEIRIGLAGDGLPKGGAVGFEIFDQTSLGMTGFVEKLKYVRALQGELERTIGALDGVNSVRVHITQPEKSVFAKKGSAPTASVLLRLRPGAELEKKQIKGIANLVAGSVEGLQTEGVTIVDAFGNLLTPQDKEGDEFGIEATRLQYQRDIEKSYVSRIEQMLSRIVGTDKIVARVTTELDYSQSEREEESFDPGGQVARSERVVTEGAGNSQRGGIPGVVSNLTNDPNLLTPPTANADSSSRQEEIKNYEVSRAVTKSSVPRGRLVRLSVAVLVDGNYVAPAGAAADAPKVFQPLEQETLQRIENLVKSAVGYDSVRGDTVTVENIQFNVPDNSFTDMLDKKAQQDVIFTSIQKGVPILFVLLFFFVVMRPLIKFMITPTDAEVDLTRLLPTGIEELEQELKTERSKADVPELEPTVDIAQLEELLAENSRVVQQNPQQAALLIRYWLNDGRSM